MPQHGPHVSTMIFTLASFFDQGWCARLAVCIIAPDVAGLILTSMACLARHVATVALKIPHICSQIAIIFAFLLLQEGFVTALAIWIILPKFFAFVRTGLLTNLDRSGCQPRWEQVENGSKFSSLPSFCVFFRILWIKSGLTCLKTPPFGNPAVTHKNTHPFLPCLAHSILCKGRCATTTVGVILPSVLGLVFAVVLALARGTLQQRCSAGTTVCIILPHIRGLILAIVLALTLHFLQQRSSATTAVGIILPSILWLVLAVAGTIALGALCQTQGLASLAIWIVLPNSCANILAVRHAAGSGSVGNVLHGAASAVWILLPSSRPLVLAPGCTRSWCLCCILFQK